MLYSVSSSLKALQVCQGWWPQRFAIFKVFGSWCAVSLYISSDILKIEYQRRDNGWYVGNGILLVHDLKVGDRIHTCLEEAENERMHLM